MATITARKDQDGIVIGYQVHIRKRGFPTQTKTFRAKKDAEAWGRVIESSIERGIWRDQSEAERTTLKEALDRYLDEVTCHKKNGKPEQYKIRHIQSLPMSQMFLANIRGREVAAMSATMTEDGLSANTVRLYLAVLSHLFKVARTEWGMEAITNPVESVRKPKLPQGRDRRLVGDEETRLLDACRADENQDILYIVQFAMETGMRRAEICGLQWENVSLPGRTALLPDTKNGTARRVPLSSAAFAVLSALPRRLDGRVWNVRPDNITRSFERACRRANIEGLTFHDLRHEATSRLFEKGLNPMQVAAITGHKTLQMLKRYTHLRAEDLAKLLG